MIMAAFEDGVAEGVISGDVDMAFVGKDACFDLPVGKLRTEGERTVLMHGLECLKDKGVTSQRGFNAMGECGVNEVDKEGGQEESDVSVVGVIRR